MGGKTAMMIGMVVIAIAAPYAAAAFAPGLTGGAVVTAAGGGLTATTTGLTLAQSALLTVGNIGLGTSLAIGSLAGSLATGQSLFGAQDQGTFSYAPLDSKALYGNDQPTFGKDERSEEQTRFNDTFDPNNVSAFDVEETNALLTAENSGSEDDKDFGSSLIGTFGSVELATFESKDFETFGGDLSTFGSDGFETFGSEFKTFEGSLS